LDLFPSGIDMTNEQARRIAADLAKLPDLVKRPQY
jgi:hypothetical protein